MRFAQNEMDTMFSSESVINSSGHNRSTDSIDSFRPRVLPREAAHCAQHEDNSLPLEAQP